MAILKPQTPLTPEQQLQRRRNLGVGLAALSETLRGGDPVARTLGLMEQFEQQEAEANLNALIEQMDIPETQKNLFQYLSPKDKAQAVLKTTQTSDDLFKGQGLTNQFYNVLLQGQKDESVRESPIYKTAYDYLSQPKTETYINEVGQQVTRKTPGIISKDDYLAPIGFAAVEEKPVVAEPEEEKVVKVSPERRKTLQSQIDTVDNSERKILAFQKKLEQIKPNPLTRGEDRADIQSSYTALLLELKNLEQLGVLAGPDLDLLQSMVGDPTGFQQFFIAGGTAGINKQLNNLLQSIRDRKTPIYKELGMKEPKGAITQTTQTAYLKGRKIQVNPTGDGWIYSDTGEAVE